jgi:hypothetical protein
LALDPEIEHLVRSAQKRLRDRFAPEAERKSTEAGDGSGKKLA